MQAKGRLQCWKADGAGKAQAATLEQQRLTARGLGGSCREEAMQQLEDCKGGDLEVPHLRWRVLGVLGQTAGSNALTREGYVQAKGRLQCWKADGAGKAQAATLEQQRLTARGLGGSCREEAMQQLEDCKGGGRWREGFGGL